MTSEPESDDTGSRGRPRDPSVEQRVLASARQELADRGIEGFSLRAVARSSGVSRPSLQLRWAKREDLITDVLYSISHWPARRPANSILDDLRSIVADLVTLLSPPVIALQMRLFAEASQHPELMKIFQQRVMNQAASQIGSAFDRAMERGELPEDTDRAWATDAVVGTVLIRTLASTDLSPLSQPSQEKLIASTLHTLGFVPPL